MIDWIRDLHWSFYYVHGWRWLPKAEPRKWNILLLPGMEPPLPRDGYVHIVHRMNPCEAGYDHAMQPCPVHQPLSSLFGGQSQ